MPDDTRVYVVGDIHGRSDLLEELLGMISAHADAWPGPRNRLVFLGDYVDRGPDSHDVVECLLHKLPAGMEADFLMGNHERLMLDAWADSEKHPLWIANGGKSTEMSYIRAAYLRGESEPREPATEGLVPPRHWMFFEHLKLHVRFGDYLFVHAGIRPGIPIERQTEADLLWIRQPFLDFEGDHGAIVVHGHTPAERPEERKNRIGIDTGAAQTGRLTALVLHGNRRRYLETGGD